MTGYSRAMKMQLYGLLLPNKWPRNLDTKINNKTKEAKIAPNNELATKPTACNPSATLP
jgi:hypothetical protein